MQLLRSAFDAVMGGNASQDNKPLFVLFIAALSVILFAFSALVVSYAIGLPFGKWPTEALGQTGDYFGGILNPVLTFFTFIGVLITVYLQRQELAETRFELRRQADALVAQQASAEKQIFESTFFQMLNLQNQIVEAIQIQVRANTFHRGREAFGDFINVIRAAYTTIPAPTNQPNKSSASFLSTTYDSFWGSNRLHLSHYMRFMYNVVRFIDESALSAEHKYKYIRLFRAQLSDYELGVLFYNCFFQHGQNLRVYVERYALLNNLPDEALIDPSHKALLPNEAYVYTP